MVARWAGSALIQPVHWVSTPTGSQACGPIRSDILATHLTAVTPPPAVFVTAR